MVPHQLASAFVVGMLVIPAALFAQTRALDTRPAGALRLDLPAIAAAVAPAPAAVQSTPRRDPVWEGLAIGAGIGALGGLIPDYYDDCSECHDSLYASIAVGAGIGALVDFLHRGKPAQTRADRGMQVGVAAGPARVGVAARIGWR